MFEDKNIVHTIKKPAESDQFLKVCKIIPTDLRAQSKTHFQWSNPDFQGVGYDIRFFKKWGG